MAHWIEVGNEVAFVRTTWGSGDQFFKITKNGNFTVECNGNQQYKQSLHDTARPTGQNYRSHIQQLTPELRDRIEANTKRTAAKRILDAEIKRLTNLRDNATTDLIAAEAARITERNKAE